MASTKISALVNLAALTALDSANDYLVLGNATGTPINNKILASLFLTTLSSIGHDTPKYIISSVSNTNAVVQKGLKSANSKLTITDTTSGSDKNILLTIDETAIDLSNCINTTSPFLSTVNLASNVGATILPVANGGTGVATLTDGGVLLGSGTGAITATGVLTNGQLLIGDGTTDPAIATLTGGTNVTVVGGAGTITINAAFATASGTLDMANNNIKLGTGWLSDTASAGGLTVTAANKVYVGASASEISASSLNVDSGLTFVGGKAQTLEVADNASTATFTIKGSDTTGTNAAGGNVVLQAGAGNGTVVGGHLKLVGGAATTANYGGTIQMSTYDGTTETLAVQVDNAQDVHAVAGNLVVDTATKGLVFPRTTVTQGAGALTNGVTINATAGIIILSATGLAATTNAEFTVTNSTVVTGSIILLTLQDENTTDNVQLSATTHTIADGSFKISIVNPHSSGTSSTTASKIHYLVIN